MVLERNNTKITVESDSMLAFKLIEHENVLWADGGIVIDINDMAANLDCYVFQHVRRDANGI